MDAYEAITTTRAIRRYRDEPIPEADLNRILFAATRAPSGSNRQPFRFLVLRHGPAALEARQVLAGCFAALWGAKRAGDGYDTGSGTDPTSPKARMAATMQHFVDHIADASAIVLACTRARHGGVLHDGASVYPACQNLLLAARALGYGGVMTNWHQSEAARLAEICGIPDDVTIAAVIPLGRPVGHHGPVRRRPLPDLVYEDRWEASAPWAVDPPGTRFTGGPPAP
ncbi:MAG: nitroreductase family protein [Acidimicrobiales bacterium]|nr:nitroreductase family protein [Acidimicrobiales bacterium]